MPHYLSLGFDHEECELFAIFDFLSILISSNQGNFKPERATDEPDAHIIELNSELSECDDHITSALPFRERR
jgi:hypothetical protein